jgi:hypothetical protein
MTSSSTCDIGLRGSAASRARRFAAIACAIGIGLGAPGARAQAPKKRDTVVAEALFKAGRALVEKGDYAAGCPKFEASLALNPSASTMINIALCHEHEGKLATAWADYHRALVLNRETVGARRRRGLQEIASKGIAALDPRVPKLRVTVKGAPPGLEVSRDGKALPAAALGEPLPADPGPHEIRATAPGHRSERRTVTLEEGKTVAVELTLQTNPEVRPQEATPGATSAGRVPAWAWISGAVGLGLSGAAIGFLVDDLSAISALRENCREVRGGTYCEPGYDYAADNARKDRDFALFVGLGGAGVIAIGTAIVGIVRAGPAEKPADTAAALPWIAPGGAGATLTGSF